MAAELDQKSKEVQVARLLIAAGPEAQEIHDLFTFENNDQKKEYKTILEKFRARTAARKRTLCMRDTSSGVGDRMKENHFTGG